MTSRRARPPLVVLLFGIAACQAVPQAPSPTPQSVAEISLEFVAMWWSEAETEGLDLDDPPEKRTRVALERWEYSDPVAVPNPEDFDVVVTLSGSPALGRVEVRSEERWAIGAQTGPAALRWTQWEEHPRSPQLRFEGEQPIALRLASVALSAMQQQLMEAREWPWAYEVRVALHTASGEIARAERTLEIFPGD